MIQARSVIFVAAQHGTVRRACAALALFAICVAVASCGGVVEGQSETTEAPAVVTERSRDVMQTNDFLRLTFLSFKPTMLGGPKAKWVFVGAAAFYQPALPLKEVVRYPGLLYNAQTNLIAMRCTPRDPSLLQPTLATWPNVMQIVVNDLADQPCPATPDPLCPTTGDAENSVYCLASEFVQKYGDYKSKFAVLSLEQPVIYGAKLQSCCSADGSPKTCANVLTERYGIFPGFSGLGFAIKDSGDDHEAPAVEVLQRAITPEYLVKNVTLADADCSCISVSPYTGRDTAPLDMDFIVQRGGVGECNDVDRLGYAQR
jgi:hypothetical protein